MSTSQQQPASPAEINARMSTLVEQRNSALDGIAMMNGVIALLRDQIAALQKGLELAQKRIAELEPTDPVPVKTEGALFDEHHNRYNHAVPKEH